MVPAPKCPAPKRRRQENVTDPGKEATPTLKTFLVGGDLSSSLIFIFFSENQLRLIFCLIFFYTWDPRKLREAECDVTDLTWKIKTY